MPVGKFVAKACIGFLAAFGSVSASYGAAAAKTPNVIFILADDLGWGDPAYAGHPYMKTPNLDALAKRGTILSQFYVANPVCSPSRTAFMTSHYPSRHHVDGHFADHAINADRGMPDWLDPDVTTIADVLKSAGYATAHFGKWHLGSGKGAPIPAEYGFDAAKTVNSNGDQLGDEAKDPFFRNLSTDLIADEAIKFMKANREKPFFINFWTLLPHAKLNPTPEQLAVYKDVNFDPNNFGFAGPYKEYLKKAKSLQSQMQVFCASVTALDSGIGKLMKSLDEMGIADNTILFFSSDNGPEDYHISNAANAGVGSPGYLNGRKRSLYEGGLRTPGIVVWPNHVPAGKINRESVVASVDFLPSICKMAGVEVPATVKSDGEDVSDIFMASPRPRKRPVFWEWLFTVAGDAAYNPPRTAVRDGNYKFLINPDGSRPELYDIPNDPTELRNLAADRKEVVEKLKKEIAEWQATLPSPRGGELAKNGPKAKKNGKPAAE